MNQPKPLPLWFALLCGGIAAWAAGYLLFYNGAFRGDVYKEEGPPPESEVAAADPVKRGAQIYAANCAICHQPDGRGLPGHYPPLAGSPFVLRQAGFGESHLIRILLNGLVGSVTVEGTVYNANMAAWGDLLNDAQIAAVLTYIGQSWGNAAPPVSAESVAAMRAATGEREQPWTVEELEKP